MRRGSTAVRLTKTPSVGEPYFDTTEERLYVGDGETAGGVRVAANRFYVAMPFHGDAIDEAIFGYFYAEQACSILGMLISAQDAPTGAAITIDLVNGAGAEQTKVGTLAAAATKQRTIFGSALAVAAGDVIQAKFKTVGSTLPGQNITVNLICQ